MKKSYQIIKLISKEVHVPSDDYYAKKNESSNDDINTINQSNKKRIKVYYNLNELVEITGMSIRALKYRMLDVKRKYKDVTNLLEKRDRQWCIHYTIIDEFQSKYFLKKKAIYNYKFQTIATWNPRDNYDVNYHLQLIREIKEQLPNSTMTFEYSELFDTENEAIHYLSNIKSSDKYYKYSKGDYIILPVYTV